MVLNYRHYQFIQFVVTFRLFLQGKNWELFSMAK